MSLVPALGVPYGLLDDDCLGKTDCQCNNSQTKLVMPPKNQLPSSLRAGLYFHNETLYKGGK